MKKNKIVSIFLGLTMAVISTSLVLSTPVSAATSNDNITIATPRLSQNEIATSKREKLVGCKQIYVNIQTDRNNKTTQTSYDLSTSNKKELDTKINAVNTANSALKTNNSLGLATSLTVSNKSNSPHISSTWLFLNLNIYSSDNVHYNLYGYFSWLTEPNNLKKDVIGISHGPQMNFDYQQSYADITNPYGGGLGATIPYSENHTHLVYCGDKSIYNGQVGGNSFTFQLGYRGVGEGAVYNGKNYSIIYPSGTIYTRAIKVGSGSCELNLTYLHQEKIFTITPSVNIPLGGSLSITNTDAYDLTNLPYLLKF